MNCIFLQLKSFYIRDIRERPWAYNLGDYYFRFMNAEEKDKELKMLAEHYAYNDLHDGIK
jgi:hypothetical protein